VRQYGLVVQPGENIPLIREKSVVPMERP